MIKKALILAAFVGPVGAIAQDKPLYYWDNQLGLVQASHCEVTTLDTTPFRISQYTGRGQSDTENLRNRNGVRQSHLANGSLLRIDQGATRTGYLPVTALGIALEEFGPQHRWYTSRGDTGLLFEQSLRPIEDYSITPLNIDTELLKDEYQDLSWQVPFGETYSRVQCEGHQENREYLIFNLTNEDNEVVASVGVHHQETNIFTQINSEYRENNPYYAQQVIDELLDGFSQQLPEAFVPEEGFGPKARPENLVLQDSVELPAETPTSETTVQEGLQLVVCTSGASLNVRDESLEEVLFQAYPGDEVVVRQTFENEENKLDIGGEEFNFVEVSFPNREAQDQKLGFVADNFIMAQADCPFAPRRNIVRGPETTITGLDDEACCEFPTVNKVIHAYTSGMRMFGARRGGGTRSHAAADLYRFRNEPILAVAPGTVVRDLYFFYQGTYALEVVHSGGFIVRYGETTSRVAEGVRRGSSVHMGQTIGYMGVVNSGCCRPMLHFELFRGNRTGSLTQTNRPYNRRSDLMNPTPYLLRWEREKF